MNTEVGEGRKMGGGGFKHLRILAMIVVAIETLAISASVYAAGSEEDIPATSIVSGDSAPVSSTSPAAADSASSAGAPTTTAPAPRARTTTHHRHATATSRAPEVEPAHARLKLVEDTWVYSAPSKSTKHIEHVTKDKYVVVTGSTHYYLQVRLKDGQTGYLDPSAVNLITPTDKVFMLTHDAAVLDKPNRWGKKLAEVHAQHNVHAVGISLNYMMIKMKNGLEGFIPITALE